MQSMGRAPKSHCYSYNYSYRATTAMYAICSRNAVKGLDDELGLPLEYVGLTRR